jgi:transcriptional repressor NrdR
MVCIYCGNTKTQVTNSRLQKRVNTIWRRRSCSKCLAVFTTIEQPDLSTTIAVRMSSKTLLPLQRDKLLVSIYDSCKHRATAYEDATELTKTCIADIIQSAVSGVVDRNAIVAITGSVLDRFDKVAATMYRAYHPLKAIT